jgi:hypothetical protein
MRLRLAIVALIAALLGAAISVSHARDNARRDYAGPDVQEYFKTLKQPDNDTSCCGDGDAWYADKVDTGPNGELIAIITDTRPDTWKREDGTSGWRPHVAVGTRIVVPAKKIRKPPVPNPTDHTIIFLYVGGDESGVVTNASDSIVICYEPMGLY